MNDKQAVDLVKQVTEMKKDIDSIGKELKDTNAILKTIATHLGNLVKAADGQSARTTAPPLPTR